jgi:RNase P subunit RPR2
MSNYLKSESYYIDLYDLSTIEECLRLIEAYGKSSILQEFQDYQLFFVKGERYRNKSSTIREWMQKDQQRDQKLEAAREPANVTCLNCAAIMAPLLKQLVSWEGGADKVLFSFECRSCGKRRGIYEDRTPYVSRPSSCSKCNAQVAISIKVSGAVFTINTTCASCGFKEEDVDDSEKSAAERAKREQLERQLLAEHRSEFCISEAGGDPTPLLSHL